MQNIIDMSEVNNLIEAEFSSEEDEDDGYKEGAKDAIESAVLAISTVVPEITTEQLKEIVMTVSDAIANNM